MGNACLDTFLELAHWPQPGEKREIRRQTQSVGGQVAGALAGMTRLGLATEFLLRTGDDDAGAQIRAALQHEKVGLRFSRVVVGSASARATILVASGGERIVLWETPADLAVGAEEISTGMLEGACALFFDGRDGPACARAATLARKRGIPVIADLDHEYSHTAELIPLINHLIVPASMAHLACPGVTVVTRGAAGCEGAGPDGNRQRVSAYPIDVVDTTGAGDAFHAGYVYALLQAWPLLDRLHFASAAAALACRGLGALASLPKVEEVRALLATTCP